MFYLYLFFAVLFFIVDTATFRSKSVLWKMAKSGFRLLKKCWWYKRNTHRLVMIQKGLEAEHRPYQMKKRGWFWKLTVDGFQLSPNSATVEVTFPDHCQLPWMSIYEKRLKTLDEDHAMLTQPTGDPQFDQRFHVICSNRMDAALLTHCIRTQILNYPVFELGSFHLKVGGLFTPRTLNQLQAIIAHFETARATTALFENLTDPEVGVRSASLHHIHNSDLKPPDLEEKIAPMLTAEDPVCRAYAAVILNRMDSAVLKGLIDDPLLSPTVLNLVLTQTRKSHSSRWLKMLRDLLDQDHSWVVRRELVEFLCEVRDTTALPRIVELVRQANGTNAQKDLIAALYRMKSPEAANALVDLLEEKQVLKLEAAREAVNVIGQCGRIELVHRLRTLERNLALNLKQEINNAVIYLQAGASDSEQGGLTLSQVAEPEGNLSLTPSDDQQGALSPQPEAAGGLSSQD